MAEWSFLTNHARALVCIAHDPGVRLRDIAAALGITERTAFGIVTDLTEAGYVVKDKDGRRNRYRIQEHLPLPEAVGRERTIGEVLRLLIDTRAPESRNCQTETPLPTDQLQPVANARRGVTESLRRRATCARAASELRTARRVKIGDSERLVSQADVTAMPDEPASI
jgi:DNA-binding transcriptional ArsR family regulator